MGNTPQEAPGDGALASGVHEPFTLAERFQQLNDVDNDIISLLSLANNTLRPLSAPITAADADSGAAPKDFSNPASINTNSQVAAFKDSVDGFLTTLHSVDVRLKRQIWALEEDGIISLKEHKGAGVSLEPNGVGDIGNLDVGWLNSRSSMVDRDMEGELWLRLRESLGKLGYLGPAAEGGPSDGAEADK